MKKGNFIKVKEGILDPDYDKYDMSGWQGVVTEVNEESPDDVATIGIDWDIQTLKQLPSEFVRDSVQKGFYFSKMNLAEDTVIIIEGKLDKRKERDAVIAELESEYEYETFDEEDLIIAEIIESKDIKVSKERLEKYKVFLVSELEKPVVVTGCDIFSWEERFFFGGDKREFAKMRKTNPSSEDTFILLNIMGVRADGTDLVAQVKRKKDKKVFRIRLSFLEAVEEDSHNGALLASFSYWVANWS